ncbi:MAG: dTMP kinase [Fimbriiglobus sp.]
MSVPITVPELGTEIARVTAWFVRPGERVYEGDRVVEVTVPGATVDVPAPVSGTVTECRAHVGDGVRADQVLGVIEAELTDFCRTISHDEDTIRRNRLVRIVSSSCEIVRQNCSEIAMPAFVSLDGLDGTGKSTQCRLLVEWLRERGIPVTHAVDPGGTELGAKLREILLFGREYAMSLRAEALLFMASRAELVDRVIRPALARGDVVVSDRFTLANVVYQGHAGGLDPADLWAVGAVATAGLSPDLTLVFDMPPDAARDRRGRAADRVESRGADYHERVRAGFLAEAARQPEACVVVDASPSVAEVHATVRRQVGELLRARGYAVPEG